MNQMWTKRIGIGIVVCAMLTIGAFSNVTYAGEITGNGKWIAGSPSAPLNGQSECAYSGRQDDPTEPGFRNVLVQAWGQIEKATRVFLTTIGMNPGTACSPAK